MGTGLPQQLQWASKADVLWQQWGRTHVRCSAAAAQGPRQWPQPAVFLQASCCQALRTLSNVLERQQALSNPANYGPLIAATGLQQRVLNRQLLVTAQLLQAANDSLVDAQRTVQELEKLYISASTATRSLDLVAAVATCNAVPPTAQVVDYIHDMWIMCRDELQLRIAALSCIPPTCSLSDVAALQSIISDQPHLDEQHIASWLEGCRQVLATYVPPAR